MCAGLEMIIIDEHEINGLMIMNEISYVYNDDTQVSRTSTSVRLI